MIDAIFDANSLYARAWYASLGDRLRDDSGRSVAGISATLNLLLSILDPRRSLGKVDRTLFCWDTRQKKDKKREPKPPEYDEELARLRDLLPVLFGAANAVPPAHEGDDAVATAVDRSCSERVFVVSGDKDLQQLQGGHVSYYCLNEKTVLSRNFILHRWHVKKPSQIAIALAILGDPGDCVPGIKGWGERKVEKLFEAVTEEMNFSQALEAIDAQIPDKHKDIFYTSLDLTLLDPEVPGVPEPSPLQFTGSDVLRNDLGMPETADFYDRIRTRYERGWRASWIRDGLF